MSVDNERLAKVEAMLKILIEALERNKNMDLERTNSIISLTEVVNELLRKGEVQHKLNEEQKKEISKLLREVEAMKDERNFLFKIKKIIFDNKLVMFLVLVILILLANNTDTFSQIFKFLGL